MKPNLQIVSAYQQAHNEHQWEQVMQLFAPDIRFEMVGIWVKQDADLIAKVEQWDAVLNSQLTFSDLREKDGGVVCQAFETNDWLALVGIEKLIYSSVRFEFGNGLIKKIKAQMAPESEQAMARAINKVTRWALDSHREVVQKLIPRSNFIYGHDEALQWKALLEEWRAQLTE